MGPGDLGMLNTPYTDSCVLAIHSTRQVLLQSFVCTGRARRVAGTDDILNWPRGFFQYVLNRIRVFHVDNTLRSELALEEFGNH